MVDCLEFDQAAVKWLSCGFRGSLGGAVIIAELVVIFAFDVRDFEAFIFYSIVGLKDSNSTTTV